MTFDLSLKCLGRSSRKSERVDWMSVSQSESGSDIHGGGDNAAELLMYIRRPDKICLRMERSLVHISSSCGDRDCWKFTLAIYALTQHLITHYYTHVE